MIFIPTFKKVTYYNNLPTYGQKMLLTITNFPPLFKESSRVLIIEVLNCSLEKSEFELQSRYYVHFRTNASEKNFEPVYSPCHRLNSIIALLQGLLCWLICHRTKKQNQTSFFFQQPSKIRQMYLCRLSGL